MEMVGVARYACVTALGNINLDTTKSWNNKSQVYLSENAFC